MSDKPFLFDRPVFIISPPRSGSTLLFELLSRSPDVWTLGGENHALLEGIAPLHPASRGWESNRLTAADATPPISEQLSMVFAAARQGGAGLRFLEKTPKNSLRIPFLAAVFPDALFIHLYRGARETTSSMLDAWRSGRFTTYPELPGWPHPPWSMLLFSGWRNLIGQPLAATVVQQWHAAEEQLVSDLALLLPSRRCSVSYEELLASPRTTLERLAQFAGLAWDASDANHIPMSRAILTPPSPDKWQKNIAELAPFLSAHLDRAVMLDA